jgi:hypothetical protein
MIAEKSVLTFEELTRLESRLGELLSEAKNYKPGEKYCPISIWYKDFKPQLIELVGWWAKKNDETLHSKAAYDLAYETVNHALPGCPKNCHGCG